FISDINNELINFYKIVKNKPKALIKQIEQFKLDYRKNPKEVYYKLRNIQITEEFNNYDQVWKAARTLFLNKTCFNGMYRVNKKGYFNTPWNRSEKLPCFYQDDNLYKISKILKKSKIKVSNYWNIISFIKKNDFVYIDPPYDQLNKNTFTSYAPTNFDKFDQIKLANFCSEINKKGAYFLLSNHNTKFIRELYKNFNITIIHAKRMINSNGNGRGEIEEVLITNY
ncbi:MAG: Dam family site-specific DNA-(adenine-N6)-methyltransferase, partial [Mycoplasma sp.]|nr:Dam family site-specific DNA-(adenine-N6)-methyltransferase [Mycoplasma sp.]